MNHTHKKNKVHKILCWSKRLLLVGAFLFVGLPQSAFAQYGLTFDNNIDITGHGYTETYGYYIDFRVAVKSERGFDRYINRRELSINNKRICDIRYLSKNILDVLSWTDNVPIRIDTPTGHKMLRPRLFTTFTGKYADSIYIANNCVYQCLYTDIRVYLPFEYLMTWRLSWESYISASNLRETSFPRSRGVINIVKKIIPPSIVGVKYDYKISQNEFKLSWEYTNKSKVPFTFTFFRQEANSNTWKRLSTSQSAEVDSTIHADSLINGSCSFKLKDKEISKDWIYAVCMALKKERKADDDPYLDTDSIPQYMKTVFVNMKKPTPQNLSADFSQFDYNLKLNWYYISLEDLNWQYSFFRKEKESDTWEKLPRTVPVKKDESIQGIVSFPMTAADFGKDWVYAISLDSIATDTLSSVAGHVDSVSVSIHPPYPQELVAQIDTLTHELQMKWWYENPQELKWKYGLYKKKKTAKTWKLVTDTIRINPSPVDTVCISLNPKKVDLHSDWSYIISLIEGETPKSPSDSYYTQEVEVAAILPPIPYGKYLMWAGIGLVILLLIAIIIMTRMGYRL